MSFENRPNLAARRKIGPILPAKGYNSLRISNCLCRSWDFLARNYNPYRSIKRKFWKFVLLWFYQLCICSSLSIWFYICPTITCYRLALALKTKSVGKLTLKWILFRMKIFENEKDSEHQQYKSWCFWKANKPQQYKHVPSTLQCEQFCNIDNSQMVGQCL